MDVEHLEVSIRELFDQYKDETDGGTDDEDKGVWGYGGRLNIRPSYQREFVYKGKREEAVIETILKGYPIGVFYWAGGDDDKYEMLDGQQRTISICRYCTGMFGCSVGKDKGLEDRRYIYKLDNQEKEKFLNYKIMVFLCKGTASEKLGWFRSINTGGVELTSQEMRSAIYNGPWVEDAKRRFVRGGVSNEAAKEAAGYYKKHVDRQEFLEMVIRWHCGNQDIDRYMAEHQNDTNAYILYEYFGQVIRWAKYLFPSSLGYKEMQKVPWGDLYREFGAKKDWDLTELHQDLAKYMGDGDVQNKVGIFRYLLSGKAVAMENAMDLRRFSDNDKYTKWMEQGKKCAHCGAPVEFNGCEADHIQPWREGGRTTLDNLQVLCRTCNRSKGGK